MATPAHWSCSIQPSFIYLKKQFQVENDLSERLIQIPNSVNSNMLLSSLFVPGAVVGRENAMA